MKTKSVTHDIILGSDARADLLAVNGDTPWISVARLLDDCLSHFDLTEPANVGVTLLIDGVDFSFLLPERRDGEFTTIASLIGIWEQKLRGFDELTYEVQDRYEMLSYRIGQLRTNIYDRAEAEASLAT